MITKKNISYGYNEQKVQFLVIIVAILQICHNRDKLKLIIKNSLTVIFYNLINYLQKGLIMDNLKHLKSIANTLKILYVEDDLNTKEQTLLILSDIFSQIHSSSNGEEALIKYTNSNLGMDKFDYYDIIITDIKMPIKNGIDLSKDILKLNKKQAIVVTSAHDDSKYLIELINLGIKNFLQKPLEVDKIIESLLNVSLEVIENREIINKINFINGYKWCKKERKLEKDGRVIELSSSELVLLELLITNPYLTFSYEEIFESLSNNNFKKELSIDSIKSIIKRVRKKIPHDLIKNIYGSGYKINTELFL